MEFLCGIKSIWHNSRRSSTQKEKKHFLKNNNETVKFLNKTNKKENDRTNQFSGYGRPVAAVTGLRNPVIEMDSSASQWSHPFWLRNPTDPEQIYIIDFIKFKHNNKKNQSVL